MKYAHTLIAALTVLPIIACGDSETGPPDVTHVNVSGVYAAQLTKPIPISGTLSCEATDGEERPAFVHEVEVGLFDDDPDPEVEERVYVSVRRATESGDCWTRSLYWGRYVATTDSILPTRWVPEDAVGMDDGAWTGEAGGAFEVPVVQVGGRVMTLERVG